MISIQNLYYMSLCATVRCSESLTVACSITKLNLAITHLSHKTNVSGVFCNVITSLKWTNLDMRESRKSRQGSVYTIIEPEHNTVPANAVRKYRGLTRTKAVQVKWGNRRKRWMFLTVWYELGRQLTNQFWYLVPLALWATPLNLGFKSWARLPRRHLRSPRPKYRTCSRSFASLPDQGRKLLPEVLSK